ncbi:hypothetical protein [Leptolyngbya sp. 7M]|nr:hypothetical protein [Leptolyngbya sp. 7M]
MSVASLKGRDLLSMADLSAAEIHELLELAAETVRYRMSLL